MVLAALGLFYPARSTSAASPKAFIEPIGTLDRFAADVRAALGPDLVPEWSDVETDFTKFGYRALSGTGVIIPEMRQLWQFYPHTAEIRTGIVVRNLDTMRIEKTLILNEMLERATADNATLAGDWSHAVDRTGGRLFLAGCSCTSGRPTHVFEFDLHDYSYKKRPGMLASMNPTSFFFPDFLAVAGMTYDPFEDDLVILFGGPPNNSAGNTNAFLYRLDLSAPENQPFDPAKLYRLRACTGPVGSTEGGDDTVDWEMLVSEEYLYVPCMRAGHTVIVVRTPRPEGNDPQHPEDVAAGPVYGEAVLADQASGRLFAVALTGQEIWVFEAATMSFVGVVATGPALTTDQTGFGFDPTTGRMFFQSPSFGLGVIEGRFFPIPQARTSPYRANGQERILSDAATGRVFVLPGHGAGATKHRSYQVYRIDPAPVPPPPPDPDRNTADVDERQGGTEARWNASGSGYGTRVLLAKGYATVPPAPTAGSVAPTAGLGDQLRSRCGYTDRDVFAGRVAKAEYDTGSTAAAAIAADVDNTTEQDLNQPSRCGELGFLGDAERWAYTPATCTSSDGGDSTNDPATAKGLLGDRSLGTAHTTCPAPGGVLAAAAETRWTDVVGIEVERSHTSATVQRTAEGGVTSTVEATAQGVSIDTGLPGVGVVTIGEIRSRATSASNGRPKRRAMSTHDIEIFHVRVGNGPAVCELKCDLVELEETLNTLAGSRAVFRTGHGPNSGRDDALLEGSPRGAQTAVQKSAARQTSDRALVGDYTVEVPALELTVFNDNAQWGRARQIYQFAGVATTATYNIVVRPSGFPPNLRGPENAPIANSGNTPYGDIVGDLADLDDVDRLPTTESTVADGGDNDPGGLAGVVRAVARGLRLFLTSPRHSLLLLTAWALLSSPAVLSRRRRLLSDIGTG